MLKKILLSFVILIIVFISQSSHAQYWHRLPKVEACDRSLSPGFSNDEKKVFYIAPDSLGIKNVFAVDLKGGAPMQITRSATPVVRLMHVYGRPLIIYMKAVGKGTTDYHLYRANNNGTDELDLTPTGEGVRNEMLGSSFNGRFMYYAANKQNKAKIDYFGYDILQNLSETVFVNEKDADLLAWSRDQKRLIMQDPATTTVWNYDINSTDRNQLYAPIAPKKVKQAMLSADNKTLYVLEADGANTELRSIKMTSPTEIGDEVVPIAAGIATIDISVNGKFLITTKGDHTTMRDLTTLEAVYSPADPIIDLQTNSKETLVLQTVSTANGRSLQVYDLAKKTTVTLVTVK